MISYASATGTKRNLVALKNAGWRLIISPNSTSGPRDFKYALDNGAWSAFTKSESFCDQSFVKLIDMYGKNADFIVIPDIVEGGRASLEFSLSWLQRLRGSGFVSLLLAVQDGIFEDDIRKQLSDGIGLFVGGSTQWKESTMEYWGDVARKYNVWLHIGRVNTVRRIALCAAAGADSFDGSSASRFCCTLNKLDNAKRQQDLFA